MPMAKRNKIHNTRFIDRAREHKALFAVYFLLRLSVVLILIAQILNNDWENAFYCVLALVLMLVPSFIETNWHIDIPDTLEIIVLLFIYAAEILGIARSNLHFLDYPDGGIAFDCHETERLKALLGELKPDAVFIPHKGEGWSDHIESGNIVKFLLEDNEAVEIYEYCVWFWYYNVWNIDWKNARTVTMTKEQHQKKLQAMDAYIKPLAPCGKPWSGVLPKVFLWANRWNKELYFNVK